MIIHLAGIVSIIIGISISIAHPIIDIAFPAVCIIDRGNAPAPQSARAVRIQPSTHAAIPFVS